MASPDATETVESVWATPAEVLSRYASGAARLMFPTIKNLETLARFDTVDQLLDAARTIRPVPVSAPRFSIGGMRLQPPSRPESPCLT
jgi:hypothetical protein